MSPIQSLYEGTQDERLKEFLGATDAWEKRAEICALVARIIAGNTTGQWIDRLRAHGVWVQRVNSYNQCLEGLAVKALDPTMEIEAGRAGPVKLSKFPVNFSAGAPTVRYPPPEVGEHASEVLREAGYTTNQP